MHGWIDAGVLPCAHHAHLHVEKLYMFKRQ